MDHMPFTAVASPAPAPEKRLIVSDWNLSISLQSLAYNAPLLKFLTLAQDHGHTVVIATKSPNHGALRDGLKVAARVLDYPVPQFRIESKVLIREVMAAEGYSSAFVVFDDEPHLLRGESAYISAKHIADVEQPDGFIKNLARYAQALGFGPQLQAHLQMNTALDLDRLGAKRAP